ncbi:MAG: DUF89 family protein [Anaerovibrio sp.]|nr:DUF89 family protein [Anaerovibrio sp.]
MKVIESCAECLYDKVVHLTDNEGYLSEVRSIIANRTENDTAPYLIYQFAKAYERCCGKASPYKEIKKKFNDLVLSMESSIRRQIECSDNPLKAALMYARIGNYIDFGAMKNVDEQTFLSLFDKASFSDDDEKVMGSFIQQCRTAKEFLLITDNCGEIVLDKLFIEQLKKRFPDLNVTVMVRGDEVINDATMEDAEYVGINTLARVISNGAPVAGTVLHMLSDEGREALEKAEVILAKGQGNYESLCGQGKHVFYSFLCKCDVFTERFNVPKLTGLFVEEW